MSAGLSLVVAWLMTISAAFSGVTEQDLWYRITIRDAPCGYLHETVRESPTRIRTESLEHLRIDRGGTVVELSQGTTFEEDQRGTPLSATVRIDTGGRPVRHEYDFPEGHPRALSRESGGQSAREDANDAWLTPSEVRAFLKARIAAGATRVTYRTLDPYAGMRLVEIELTRVGSERREVLGRTLELGRWRMRSDGSSILVEELRTAEGILVSSVADVGLGMMTVELVDRETALRALDAPPPELLDATLVPIRNMVGRTDDAVTAGYRVFFDTNRSWELPDSGSQHVRTLRPGGFEVTIDAASGSTASAQELADPALRSASAYIDIDDPGVRRFFRELEKRPGDTTLEACDRLRVAVARQVSNKTFGVAFGSASDALRSRSGDCTEHAVLLAAGFRLAGLPARIATGLVHAPASGFEHGAFAWHMWTQVLIDGLWWDFDATRKNRFDAGHLLVSTSSLDGGTGERALSEMLLLLGRMRVEVICVDGLVLDEKPTDGRGDDR